MVPDTFIRTLTPLSVLEGGTDGGAVELRGDVAGTRAAQEGIHKRWFLTPFMCPEMIHWERKERG